MSRQHRVSALEQAGSDGEQALHCITRYGDESVDQAVAAHEANKESIGPDRNVLRVIVSKPDGRPTSAAQWLAASL